MGSRQEKDRQSAIERYHSGESPSSICAALGYTRAWFYKWLKRFREGGEAWFRSRPRGPRQVPNRTDRPIEQIVVGLRRALSEAGLFRGSQNILWEMEELGVQSLPSLRTIGRILKRHDLIQRRAGPYRPKGKRYPALAAKRPGDVHQTDFVGPCYLRGPVRFYSLNSVDVATGRCALEPLLQRGGQALVEALWASWRRMGLPRHQQVDNEWVFLGSPRHPRGMGKLIRLCLLHGIQAWFIPPREPWRNGVVEKFNHHWRDKFLRRVLMKDIRELKEGSRAFEKSHNGRYRYGKLGGRTPQAALADSGFRLRFPPTMRAPRCPLPKPETGRYHLIRFIRSDGLLDVFGERFKVPPEAVYEYVRATIDVDKQRLGVYLDHLRVDEYEYRLR